MSRLQVLVEKQKYEGKIFPSRNFGNVVVLEYLSSRKILVRFINTGYENTVNSCDLKRGAIKDNLAPTVLGVGRLGYADAVNSNGDISKEYKTWLAMLKRCYAGSLSSKNTSYFGCTVSDNFKRFDYFKGWCSDQAGFFNDDFQLDKDLLIKGNKIYSESNCCFVPSEINLLLTRNGSRRGNFPIGVSYKKQLGKFSATCNIDGKTQHLGYYDNPESAFRAYKTEKERYIKVVSEKWRDKIDEKVYKALNSYSVSISD